LLVILVGAAWLRLSAVGLDRPSVSFQPDEDANLLRALGLAGGDLNPHFFYYPDLLWLVLAEVFRVVFGLGHWGCSATGTTSRGSAKPALSCSSWAASCAWH
jgi:hypothetical protein